MGINRRRPTTLSLFSSLLHLCSDSPFVPLRGGQPAIAAAHNRESVPPGCGNTVRRPPPLESCVRFPPGGGERTLSPDRCAIPEANPMCPERSPLLSFGRSSSAHGGGDRSLQFSVSVVFRRGVGTPLLVIRHSSSSLRSPFSFRRMRRRRRRLRPPAAILILVRRGRQPSLSSALSAVYVYGDVVGGMVSISAVVTGWDTVTAIAIQLLFRQARHRRHRQPYN